MSHEHIGINIGGGIILVLANDIKDSLYVEKAGDTMTGKFIINPSTGTTSLNAQKNIVLKSGQKLVFDGE